MSGEAIVVRAAAREDLAAVLSLYRHLNPADPILSSETASSTFAAMLAHPGMTLLVAGSGDTLTSTITLIVIPNLTRGAASYALIENVVTDPNHRNRGHAGALIRHATDLAFQAGCYKVMLLTGSTEQATLDFYRGCGFVQNKTSFQIRRPLPG